MKAGLVVRFGMAIAATFAAAIATAQGPGGPGFGMHRPPMERAMRSHSEFGRWWNNPKIIERLKLTEDQRKAMDDIFQKHREKLVDLRGNLEKAEIEMDPLVKADQPNETAVMSQIDKVAQARAELEKANARFLFALRAKLSPEQWKQVQEFRQNHDGMRREWRRDGRGPGGPGGDDKGAPPPPPGPQGMLGDGPADEISSFSVNQ
ncbi:MAG: Spy/CpxP family protein refolding chaperone [Acidobacteria bacterium]|nr:Spy/CpxP family protein refolding chaperone [Acidobacteriota bacterium]